MDNAGTPSTVVACSATVRVGSCCNTAGNGFEMPPVPQLTAELRPWKQRALEKLGILRADRGARLREVLSLHGCVWKWLRICSSLLLKAGVLVRQDQENKFAVDSMIHPALHLESISQRPAVYC